MVSKEAIDGQTGGSGRGTRKDQVAESQPTDQEPTCTIPKPVTLQYGIRHFTVNASPQNSSLQHRRRRRKRLGRTQMFVELLRFFGFKGGVFRVYALSQHNWPPLAPRRFVDAIGVGNYHRTPPFWAA